MQISIEMIRALREQTGAGMMNCQKALAESGGDLVKAAAALRKAGWTAMEQKTERKALEGLVQAVVSQDHRRGAMLEVNCETDFVAMNPAFRRFVLEAAEIMLKEGAGSREEVMTLGTADGRTIGESLRDLAAIIGENLVLRRCVCWEAGPCGAIAAYVHRDYLAEGKVGVLVEVAVFQAKLPAEPIFAEVLKDLALQIASAKPLYVRREEIPAQAEEKLRAGFLAEALAEGKSEVIAVRVAEGRLEKYRREASLMEQPFLKDQERTVGGWLAERSAVLGGEIAVRRLIRFEKGEEMKAE